MFTYLSGNYGPVATQVIWPDASAPSITTTITVSAPVLPEMSLKGQTWGWVIPITAGKRTVPGRPIWRRIRRGTDTYYMDFAVSFGWRAEIMADDPGVDLSFKRLLVNGVVIRDVDAGITAPGVTVTFYDGTQTTADPFLVSVDGADDVQAFVYHMYAVVQNLPLLQFGNQQPDSFAADVIDSGPDMTLARALTLLADLSRDMKGKVTIGANITETIDNLFIVEQGSFNSFALNIGRLCDFDLRETNNGVEIVRAADGDIHAALTEDTLLRAPGESGLVFTRTGDDNLPAEVRAQFVASEASFKFSERPARRDFGPMPTTTSTRVDTIRVPLGMPVNAAQTYVSGCLYRETDARDQVRYALPWSYAVKVQAGDIHTVPDGDDLLTVKVTRADLTDNRTLNIEARRLHTALDYDGQAIVGETPVDSFVAIATYTGALSVTEAPDVVAITGTGSTTITGDLAVTEAPDTVAIAGSFAAAISGSLAVTEAPDTVAIAGTAGDVDPNFASVVLLVSGNGANGSTTFTDESPVGRTLTAVGSAQVSTTSPKFGSGAILLDGTGDYVSAPTTSSFDFSGGPYTVEAFAKFAETTEYCIVSLWGGSGSCWALYSTGGTLFWRYIDTLGGITDTSVAFTPTLGQWYHIAASQNASKKVRLRVDGVMVASSTPVRSPIYNSGSNFLIGGVSGFSFDLNGRIDELRITKGVDRYDTDSAITVPTSAFPRF